MLENSHQEEINKLITQGQIRLEEPLAQHTTIKIGGPASVFIETSQVDEIVAVWQYCHKNEIPFFTLGGGSNLVFSDQGYSGVVMRILPNSEQYVKKAGKIHVIFSAGFSTHLASVKMLENSLSGFEYLYGLPGTIGGAVYMNAKWPKENFQINDNLISVIYLNEAGKLENKSRVLRSDSFGESEYQQKKGIILRVTFKLVEKSKRRIKQNCDEVQTYRQNTQPYGVFTAGCVFKNIEANKQKKYQLPSCSTGYYIERCGLKGKRIGQIQISSQHANFFINNGGATAQQYEELVELVKTKVKQKFDLDLQEEIILVK